MDDIQPSVPPARPISPELIQLLTEMEQRIGAERAAFAERAFGMGCSALTVPMLLILGVFYLAGVRSWAGIFVILVIAGLTVFLLAALFASRAQAAAGKRVFQQTILPEIQAYAAENNLMSGDILQAAEAHLPHESALKDLLKAI